MKISIGSTLSELRKAKKFMQKDIAAKLSAYGIHVSSKTIYNWEKELAFPNANQFVALCDILDVDDVLWQFAKIQKGSYAGLNQAGRQKVREFIDLLFESDRYRTNPDTPDKPVASDEIPQLYRLYDIPVSAGLGTFLDESGYEMISAPSYVPESAAFALRVSGDSMEPQIKDGQIIWIKEQQALCSGDIGIFVYSDDVYCKELVIDGSKAFLRSLNPEYEDIEIKDDFGFKTVGKVVA
ncbi:MAG: XRE family transcriptional regulator [Oscillospiraceae bacterium]|nr:XRE family transcriptional regulator [Oscillospiraceae bacterium]